MARPLLLAAALLLSLSAHAAIRLGPPQPAGSEERGAPPIWTTDFRVASTSWGYVAAWVAGGRLRVARVGKDGSLLDDPAPIVETDVTLAAELATDGEDVLIAYSHYFAGNSHHRLIRVSADGTIERVRSMPYPPSAVIWTGRSYILFLGTCLVQEAVQLDARGTHIRTIAVRFPGRACDEMAPLIYRDATGVFRLIYQNLGSDMNLRTRRAAITDANGDPIRNVTDEPLDESLAGSHFRAAGATRDGFYLLSEKFLQFLDHAGRPLRRVDFDPGVPWWYAAPTGDGAIVAASAGPDQRDLVAMRVGADGSTQPLWSGRATTGRKSVTALFPTATGAALFSIDTNARFWTAVPAMRFLRSEERGSRVRAPILLARAIADQRQVAAIAHGGGMLIAWSQQVPDAEVHVARLDSSARRLPMPRVVVPGGSARLASNGEIALVAAQNEEGTRVIRIDRDGRPLDKEPMLLPKLQAHSVVWDGGAFLLLIGEPYGRRFQAMRIDEFGRLLTPEAVPLTDRQTMNHFGALAVSPHGTLFLYSALRVPNDVTSSAIFAQRLTRDLVRVGDPSLISVADSHGPTTVLWLGDHFLFAFMHGDVLRSVRVSAEGTPLDGDIPLFLSDAYGYAFSVARLDGRTIVATPNAVREGGGLSALSGVTFDPVELIGLVTTRDGRSWLFYLVLEQAEGYQLARPYAREVTIE
jgi:hypothetical protein